MTERELYESKWCCNENMSRAPSLHSVDLSCDISSDKLASHLCYVQGIGSSMFTEKDNILLEDPTISQKHEMLVKSVAMLK